MSEKLRTGLCDTFQSHEVILFRPNAGFMEQLKLWEAMRCCIDQNNKSYRTYRLKHMAQEIKGSYQC